MPVVSTKVAISLAIIIIASGAVLVITHLSHVSTPLSGGSSSIPPVTIHDAAWYVAHPPAMQADEARCQRNDGEIPFQACQNISSAEQQLAASQLQSINGEK